MKHSSRKITLALAQGFTLIEMAIALIVIALLMIGQAKGSLLLDVAREKNLESDFRNVAAAIYAYQDKYKAIPGDDALAAQHVSAPASMVGNGTGLIDGNWYDTVSTSEAYLVWLHLRLANLVDGPTDTTAADYQPVNTFGRQLGIQSGKGDANAPIVTASGTAPTAAYFICSRGIPGRLVSSLDIKVDNGDPATGSMMATLDTGADFTNGVMAATAIEPDREYIVCLGI
jgi:prepilin-type N-terminal cleavage/methylation domain-containing protein